VTGLRDKSHRTIMLYQKEIEVKRILHVVGIMDTGGIETWLMNVLRNIDRTKIKFDFIVHAQRKGYYDDEIERLGGKIIRVPKFRLFNLFEYKKTWDSILKDKKYEILHTHVRSTASIYLRIAKKYKIMTISHAHNTSNGKFPISTVKMFLQRNISRYSDIRLACSKEAGIWLFKTHAFKVIKNGIDLSEYKRSSEIRAEYRKKYNFNNSDIVIGHVGRFSYQKNHIFLLDVFSKLHKKNDIFKLVLVGDGGLKNTIEKRIEKLNIKENVIFAGVRSDIPQLLQMFDIFFFPSHYEGLPVALIEAQAAGLHCFVSDVITNEIMITKLMHPVSLKEKAEYWADFIMQNINYEKKDATQAIKDAGFDIKAVAKELEKLYWDI